MARSHRIWNWKGFFVTLLTAGLILGTQPDAAIAQIEWRAPPCTYSAATRTGALCVRAGSFNRDICTALARFSGENDLPPDFFARLIWKESLFRPDAVSSKGAEGIAQFIPSTARLRGLSNSFDALEALGEAAEYLDDLRDRFGNIGLAATAYNAGEGGLRTFLRTGNLPQETRNYVLDITAHPAEDWRDNPPATVDLRLDDRKSFEDACVALASTRRLKAVEFEAEGVWAPWGAQLAAHFQKPVAARLFLLAVRSLPEPLNMEKPLIQKERNRAFGTRLRYTARIARQTRSEAEAVCAQVRRNGGACIVFRN
ncbi:lytic transglycosylase domain-containing protein [Pararhizobium gei]|uniref:lytic transglycosylase domain-containing protein n=1 Tax=Pararhizobium gei TaxID=1395951 RepID=UPI0023DC210C|nr:lytic transglycosylase domain-containing protein [Rhizobium gei]